VSANHEAVIRNIKTEYTFNFILILYFNHNGMSCTKIKYQSLDSLRV